MKGPALACTIYLTPSSVANPTHDLEKLGDRADGDHFLCDGSDRPLRGVSNSSRSDIARAFWVHWLLEKLEYGGQVCSWPFAVRWVASIETMEWSRRISEEDLVFQTVGIVFEFAGKEGTKSGVANVLLPRLLLSTNSRTSNVNDRVVSAT